MQVDAIAQVNPVDGHLAKAEYDNYIGRSDLAITEYNAALALKPRSIDAYWEIAHHYERAGNAAELTSVIDQAAKVNLKDARIPFYRGVALIQSGRNFPQAEQDLKAYLADSPQRSDWPPHSSARFWLGQLYEKEGNKVAAAEQYRDAVSLDSGNHEAKQALNRLGKLLR